MNAAPAGLSSRHLLGIDGLTRADANLILDTARSLKDISRRPLKKVPVLRGKTVVTLFFEASTRTRLSFEIAAKRLSADTLNFSASSSSVVKGETLLDTARNIEAMRPDLTIVRHARAVNMIPAMAMSGVVGALVVWPLAAPAAVTGTDLVLLAVMGLIVLPVSFGAVTLGPRYIPAPEVSLLFLLETVLGPLWVWLVLSEDPGPRALLGGAVVVGTLLVHSAVALRREPGRRRRAAP